MASLLVSATTEYEFDYRNLFRVSFHWSSPRASNKDLGSCHLSLPTARWFRRPVYAATVDRALKRRRVTSSNKSARNYHACSWVETIIRSLTFYYCFLLLFLHRSSIITGCIWERNDNKRKTQFRTFWITLFTFRISFKPIVL